jgi:hypothetical protein
MHVVKPILWENISRTVRGLTNNVSFPDLLPEVTSGALSVAQIAERLKSLKTDPAVHTTGNDKYWILGATVSFLLGVAIIGVIVVWCRYRKGVNMCIFLKRQRKPRQRPSYRVDTASKSTEPIELTELVKPKAKTTINIK